MKTILVTGATGKQGGAVVKHLLNDGNWKICALVRDENKESATELKKKGVEILQGDMNNPADLNQAMQGVYGVFSVQNFWEHGYDGELTQGKNLIDAAAKADVKHFLQSSVGGAERKTKLPHFDVKFEVENYLKAAQMPYTIIRPVFFMENFNEWFKPAEENGTLTLTMAMKPDTKLQMIATDDIGGIAALIFNDPKEFIGREIEIAGDELTIPQTAELYGKVFGKKAVFNELPVDVLKSNSEEMGNMFQWFIDKGYLADINAMKKMYPALTGFEKWLKNNS